MSQTLFISDLHLDQKRPHIIAAFCRFLEECSEIDALYILGDLFEYWIGDDDPAIGLEPAITSIRNVADSGTPVYFIHGNRDFLIGKRFAQQTKCTILQEETVIDLYGKPTLIMHGDTLCTDDIAYQKYRKKARNPILQKALLLLSVKQRLKMADALRDKSKSAIQEKPEDIMDVNQGTVERVMQKHNVMQLIHGHTHRPAAHEFTLNNEKHFRYVLGDWYDQGSVLRCDPKTIKLEKIAS